MNLGYIDYINCYPFYYHLFEKKPLEGVTVIPGYPSRLNAMMESGELDMSPISSASYTELQDKVVIVPDFCLSSIGYVASVVLESNVPIEELDGKKIGITSASNTSVIILKVLLKQYYKIDPEYITSGLVPTTDEHDAILLIGNDALRKKSKPVPYTYDLGDLWLRRTGYPVVFAIFVVRNESFAKFKKEINVVLSSYAESLNCLNSEKERVIQKVSAKYPGIDYDIHYYYELLQFKFTTQLKSALAFYYSSAAEMGLLKNIREIKYLSLI
jgi:chorismate dehydratase